MLVNAAQYQWGDLTQSWCYFYITVGFLDQNQLSVWWFSTNWCWVKLTQYYAAAILSPLVTLNPMIFR